MLEIVIEEVLWSIRWSHQTIWSFPLTNVKWHSVTWPYTMTTHYWSDFVPNSTFYRILSGFHRTFATGGHADRGRLLLRTPGPVPLGLAYILLVETNPFRTCRYFFPRTMLFEYPSVLDFASDEIQIVGIFPVSLTFKVHSFFGYWEGWDLETDLTIPAEWLSLL